MLLKKGLIVAVLAAAVSQGDSARAFRGEKDTDNVDRKLSKGSSSSSVGGDTVNMAAGSGKKKKKSGSGNKTGGVNRFGMPGGPMMNPQVWTPYSGLRATPNQQSISSTGTNTPVITRTPAQEAAPVTVTVTRTPVTTTSTPVVNRASGVSYPVVQCMKDCCTSSSECGSGCCSRYYGSCADTSNPATDNVIAQHGCF
mmetsp:Transcript_16280/g.35348  ORF Transcript_16280/g.35348 Transcript_16280/m.35348 type:complete len:198 (-) Transcript_16280:115-708(-)